MNKFRNELDSVGAKYTFKIYPGATHAFTNPEATKLGKKINLFYCYSEPADKKSWNEMKIFFNDVLKKLQQFLSKSSKTLFIKKKPF